MQLWTSVDSLNDVCRGCLAVCSTAVTSTVLYTYYTFAMTSAMQRQRVGPNAGSTTSTQDLVQRFSRRKVKSFETKQGKADAEIVPCPIF